MIHVFGTPGPPVPRLVAAMSARGHAARPAAGTGAAGTDARAGGDRSPGTATLVLGDVGASDPQALAVLLGAWRRAEGARLLVLSAIGAHPDARAPRLRRLWALEEQARGFALPVMVLRLAPLVGPASPLWLRLRSEPGLPGRGRPLVEPVVEEDVVEALDRVLTHDGAWEGWYEVTGPEAFTLPELVDLARDSGPRLPGDAGAWEPAVEEMAEHMLAEAAPWNARSGVVPEPLSRRVGGWAA